MGRNRAAACPAERVESPTPAGGRARVERPLLDAEHGPDGGVWRAKLPGNDVHQGPAPLVEVLGRLNLAAHSARAGSHFCPCPARTVAGRGRGDENGLVDQE